MSDDATTPVYHGNYVTYGDRTFLRMRGGDGTEEQDQSTTAVSAPEDVGTSAAVVEKPEPFSENFDPAALPDELRPAYQQLRADYTRKTQSIAQERQDARDAIELRDALQDPQKRIDALQRLGIIDPDAVEDDGPLDDDPNSKLQQEWEQFKAERAQEQAQAQEAEVEQAKIAYINHGLAELVERTGREFTEKEFARLGRLASITPDAEGLPDVQAAYDELYVDHEAELLARLKAAKRADIPPAGTAPKEDLDFDDPRVREDYIDSRMAQLASDE